MKTTLFSLKFFQGLFVTLPFMLSLCPNIQAQNNNDNNAQSVNTDNISGYINMIKDKANQAYKYSEQAYNAATVKEANVPAKQALSVLEEAKSLNKNAQIALDAFSTPENKIKCGKYLNSVASDIVDLNNKIEWATYKTNKIIITNDFNDIKPSANDIMIETKKMDAVISGAVTNLNLANQRLVSID